jgi:hypothetical protein
MRILKTALILLTSIIFSLSPYEYVAKNNEICLSNTVKTDSGLESFLHENRFTNVRQSAGIDGITFSSTSVLSDSVTLESDVCTYFSNNVVDDKLDQVIHPNLNTDKLYEIAYYQAELNNQKYYFVVVIPTTSAGWIIHAKSAILVYDNQLDRLAGVSSI